MEKLFLIGILIFLSYFGASNSYHESDVFPGHRTQGFAEHWTYHGSLGPMNWPHLSIKNNECGGRRQSPINIDSKTVSYTGRHLKFLYHNLIYLNSTLYNNGHNVNLTINKWYLTRPELHVTYTSGNVKRYIFDSVHYHFGDISDHGSEHQIDHRRFPMEMHSVYYKDKYGSYEDALKYKDGLAIISVLFYVSAENNMRLSAVTNKLAEVAHPDVQAVVPQVLLSDLFPFRTDHFFTYKGSLTTPPCTEAAVWYVLSDLYPVSELQMQQFRQLTKLGSIDDLNTGYINGYLADNVRPVQPRHGRTVYMHF